MWLSGFLLLAASVGLEASTEAKRGLMASPCQRLPRTCLLPKVTGVCRAAFPRYYFDRVSGRCKTFIYGGCRGNQNNFQNLKDCLRKCAKKCSSGGQRPGGGRRPRGRSRHGGGRRPGGRRQAGGKRLSRRSHARHLKRPRPRRPF